MDFVVIDSEILGEKLTLLINPDAIDSALDTRNLVYRPAEIELLEDANFNDKSLKFAHLIKKTFKGWIVEKPDNKISKPKKTKQDQTFAERYKNKKDHATWLDER